MCVSGRRSVVVRERNNAPYRRAVGRVAAVVSTLGLVRRRMMKSIVARTLGAHTQSNIALVRAVHRAAFRLAY